MDEFFRTLMLDPFMLADRALTQKVLAAISKDPICDAILSELVSEG